MLFGTILVDLGVCAPDIRGHAASAHPILMVPMAIAIPMGFAALNGFYWFHNDAQGENI